MKRLGLLVVLLGFATTIACGDNGSSSTDAAADRSNDARDAGTDGDGSTSDRADALASDRVDALPSEQTDASTTDVQGTDVPVDVAPTDVPIDVAPTDVPVEAGADVNITPDASIDVAADGSTDATSDASDGSTSDGAVATYTIGGTITGLTGTGLVLRNNGGADLTVAANATTFTFVPRLPQGGAYAVTVFTQPTTPSQTCTVTTGTGTGTVGTANVTSVAITCVTRTFTVGGTISGLTGTGLVLRNNGGDNLTVAANATTFTFATAVASGAPYSVTIFTQPTTPTPSQICTVTTGTGAGTVTTANITSVAITCVNRYTVGGTISGLTGTGLVLRNNAGDNLTVAANATTFTFATPVVAGGAYAVTIFTQPTNPAQTCTITTGTGSGNVAAANITSVAITCVTSPITVTYPNETMLTEMGLAGGDPFNEPCPTGQVLVGFAGAGGSLIDQIAPVCGRITVVPNSTTPTIDDVAVVAGTTLALVGGTGGADFAGALLCPTDQVVTGVSGSYSVPGGNVDSLTVTCATLATTTDHTALTTTPGTPLTPLGQRDLTSMAFNYVCPANRIVTRVSGDAASPPVAGSFVNEIIISCSNTALTTP